MTHEEKIGYMQIADSIVGYTFEPKGLDMLVSTYDLIFLKKGDTYLHSIIKVQCAVEVRAKQRIESIQSDHIK